MRRSKQRQRDAAVEGSEHCRMCGQTVPVEPDGRCDLGHRVRAATQPAAAAPAPAGEAAPVGPSFLAELASPGSEPRPALEPAAARTAAAAPAPPPAPAYAPSDGGLSSALDELLAWDTAAPSALDVSADELPTPDMAAPEEPEPVHREFVDEEAEAEEDEAARRRLATLFGGGGLTLLVLAVAAVGLAL